MGAPNLDALWLLETLFDRKDSVEDFTAASFDERSRYHEAGHAMIPLTLGGSFEHVVVYAGGRGGYVKRPSYHSLQDCISGHVAGAVAEDIKYGTICAHSCATDMTNALRRAFRLDGRRVLIDHAVGIVKDQIDFARQMIEGNMDLVEKLVAELREHHVLTFAECQEIAS